MSVGSLNPLYETVHSDADSSFRCLHFSCSRFSDDHTWHYHPEYELAYVVGSKGTRFVGDSIQHYGPGDLVLLGPDLPHCWHSEPDSGIPELMVVQFSLRCFGEGFLSLSEAAPIRHLLDSAETGLHFTGSVAARVGQLLHAAREQKGLSRWLRMVEALDALAHCDTASPLATKDYCLNSDINPLSQKRIELIYRYVRENLTGDIIQAKIAQSLKLTPQAFSRFFRMATGKTFVSFVNTLRINEACRLLNNSSASVTEIAMACGYNNLSNFNRQFFALKGINPTYYRRRMGQKAEHYAHYLDAHPL